MKQLVIKNGKIERFVNGGEKIEGAIEVTYFDGRVGMKKEQFTIKGTEWHVKPLSQQVSDKVVEVPIGYVLDGERFRPMKEIELIEAGLKEKPKGQKIVDGQLVAMTLKEQFEANEITEEEYAENIKQERDSKLSEMDKYSIMHIEGVLTDEQYKKVKQHKDYLRGIPQAKGFPKTFVDFEEFIL